MRKIIGITQNLYSSSNKIPHLSKLGVITQMKHKIFIIILIFLSKVIICQTDTLNKFNYTGKKHGYWLKYLDLNANPIDSVHSYFYGYELYDNGYKVIGFFKDKSKNSKVLEYSAKTPIKGRPVPITGEFKWYKKTQKPFT